jgi:hypothetical protein
MCSVDLGYLMPNGEDETNVSPELSFFVCLFQYQNERRREASSSPPHQALTRTPNQPICRIYETGRRSHGVSELGHNRALSNLGGRRVWVVLSACQRRLPGYLGTNYRLNVISLGAVSPAMWRFQVLPASAPPAPTFFVLSSSPTSMCIVPRLSVDMNRNPTLTTYF